MGSSAKPARSDRLVLLPSQAVTKERILVVDDEAQILTALADLFEDEFLVLKSQTPERALDLVATDRDIAVVITDQRMPSMSGDEFLARLGDQCSALRIMVSGFADLPAVVRAVNEGSVYAYVTKPWNAADLKDKVHKAAAHHRLSQELEYERQLLRELMNNSPDGIYFKDAERRFLRVNESFAATMGVSREQLTGKRLAELAGLDVDLLGIDGEERRVLAEGKPTKEVVRAYRRPGGASWLSETKAPISGAVGQTSGIVGISRDVTERVRAVEALRTSEARLQQQTRILNSILDGMAEGVVVVDPRGEALLCNREAKRVLGAEAAQLHPDDWTRSFGLYLRDRKRPLPIEDNPLRRAMQGENFSELEVVARGQDEESALLITASPLRDENGEVAGGIALLRDVTAQRSLEQQLAQSQKMEAIGQLAGGVAHDFNNLLAVIEGCGDLVLSDMTEGDPRREDVQEILNAARRASSLTKQLLAFSRKQVAQPTIQQLNEVVGGAEGMLRRLIGDAVEMTSVLRPGLSLVSVDTTQVEQILLNLVVNARDAMPGGGRLSIETDEQFVPEREAVALGAKAGRYVVLSVSDTGAGMSAETRRRIFEPFFTTKEVGKGTGLGLSTVYGLVNQAGGYVSVRSEPGSGTTFEVAFPVVEGDTPRPPEAARPSLLSPARAKILVVDDDDAVRRVAVRFLRQAGYDVVEASLPSVALGILRADTGIDLLLTDLGMPEMSGKSLAAFAASTRSRPTVVYMSGNAGSAVDPDGHYALRGDYVVEKPFLRTQLLDLVGKALAETKGTSLVPPLRT